MSFERKIQRNQLKLEQKNNKIQNAWRQLQLNTYGVAKYYKILKSNKVLGR